MSTEDIIKEAVTFSPSEKALIIEALLNSMDKPDPEIDAIWSKEAEARLDAYREGNTKAVPLDKVFPNK